MLLLSTRLDAQEMQLGSCFQVEGKMKRRWHQNDKGLEASSQTPRLAFIKPQSISQDLPGHIIQPLSCLNLKKRCTKCLPATCANPKAASPATAGKQVGLQVASTNVETRACICVSSTIGGCVLGKDPSCARIRTRRSATFRPVGLQNSIGSSDKMKQQFSDLIHFEAWILRIYFTSSLGRDVISLFFDLTVERSICAALACKNVKLVLSQKAIS